MAEEFKDELDRIVSGNYCVGCGVCAARCRGEMFTDQYGMYKPDFASFTEPSLRNRSACPFSEALNCQKLPSQAVAERPASEVIKDLRVCLFISINFKELH